MKTDQNSATTATFSFECLIELVLGNRKLEAFAPGKCEYLEDLLLQQELTGST
jgi:hypothetical protein